MLEFGDIKSKSFKEDSTSMQLLYMFQDALRMISQQYVNSKSVLGVKRRVIPQTSEVSTDSFKIVLRVYELEDLSFLVYWLSSQSAAYSSVRPDARSRIDIEYKKCTPSFVEVVYSVWVELPF